MKTPFQQCVLEGLHVLGTIIGTRNATAVRKASLESGLLGLLAAGAMLASGVAQPMPASGATGCAGSLDPTFQVPDSFPWLWSSYPPHLALRVQADGKVVVADGVYDWGTKQVTYLPPIRFNADGSLDTNYVANPADVAPHTRVVQPDGKVLEIRFGADSESTQLVRLNADGTRDASFLAELPGDFWPKVIALQPGGGILVAGGRVESQKMAGMGKEWVAEPVLRLRPDGTRDAAFYTSLKLDVGIETTYGEACLVRDMVVGPDGRIYICGFFTRVNESRRTDVARLTAGGALDLSFEADIEVCVGCDVDAQDTVSALGSGPDGKLVIAGRFQLINGLPQHAVARLQTADEGCGGVITFAAERIPVSETNRQAEVTVFRLGGTSSAVSVRYETYTNEYAESPEAIPGADYAPQAGVLTFAPGEMMKTIVIPLNNDAACEPNERIWVNLAEPTGGAVLQTPARAYVLVMDDDAAGRPGNVDAGFQPVLNVFNSYNSVRALATEPQSIWVAGVFDHVGGVARNGFARLHLNGSLDEDFTPRSDGDVAVLTADASGRILAGGSFTTVNEIGRPGLVRFNADGTVDETFHPRSFGSISSIAVQPDGKILVGGSFGVVRINGDGTTDASYQSGGYTWVSGDVNTVAPQADGKILVGGFFYSVEGQSIKHLARLNADGTLDMSFRPVGETNSDFLCVYRLAVQADGKIVAGGYFQSIQGFNRGGLVRLNADGTVDPTFVPEVSGVFQSMLLQPDGRLLVMAGYPDYPAHGRWLRGLRRLLPDGTLDPSFSVAPVWPAFESTALAMQANGDVLMGGMPKEVNGYPNSGLVRLHGDHTGTRPNDPGSISLSAPQYRVAENSWVATVKAVRVWGTHGTVSAKLATRDDAATAGEDYKPVNALIAFTDGETSEKTISIPIIEDWIGENDETVGLVLSEASGGATLGCFAGGILDIVENDQVVEFVSSAYAVSETNSGIRVEFNVRGKRDVPVTVEYATHDGTAVAGRDYTLSSGVITLSGGGYGCLPFIRILNDNLVEGSETLTMSLRIVSGTATLGPNQTTTIYIVDDEAPGPVITKQPVAQTRVVGQTATFSVGALGTTPLRYQWLFEGEEIPGAILATLTLTNLQADDNGLYEVVVSDAGGTASSEQAFLTVLQILSGPGSLDVTFDPTHGGTSPGFQDVEAYVNTVVLQPDGNVLVGGTFNKFDGVHCSGLVRLEPDGSLDKSFVLSPYAWWGVNALALTGDGKILVAFDRSIDVPEGRFNGVVRLNANGTLDPTFHTPPDIDYWFVNAVAVQTDGKVLLGGVLETLNGPKYRHILRFNPDGSLDTTFQPVPLSSDGEPRNAVNNILVESDGKIVLLGGFSRTDHFGGGLIRLWPDGSIDTSFDHLLNAWTECSGVIVQQPDGKLVMGANGWDGTNNWALVRLERDGTLDRSFTPPRIEYGVRSLALLPDGTWLVATNQWDAGGLIHLSQNGVLDPSFRVKLEPTEGAYLASVVALPNGQAIIGGRFGFVNGYPATNLARLNTGVSASIVSRQLPYQGGTTVRLVASPAAGTAAYAVEDQPPAGWAIVNISHGGAFDALTGRVKFGPFFDAQPRTLSYDALPLMWGTHGLLGVFTFSGRASANGQEFPVTGDQRLTIAGMMPPDLNPADYAISINEVTAYGTAWRRGDRWPIEPNPIPIDYVTRAAAVWRWGECYSVNGSMTDPPLWWGPCVKSSGAATLRRTFAQAICTERELPANFVPGEAVAVSINTHPAAGTAAQAVEDQVPAGWTVRGISDGGELDAVSEKVKWGPFLDDTARVLRYQAVPPATASGCGSFAGFGSFDGVSAVTVGVLATTEACRVDLGSEPTSGKVRMMLSGRVGARFQIEASTDLQVWKVVTVVTNTDGRVEFSDAGEAGMSQRFYRARLVE